jgi:hypothetical protein
MLATKHIEPVNSTPAIPRITTANEIKEEE